MIKVMAEAVQNQDETGAKILGLPITHGGPGSGNFGHSGRPGQVGGSGSGGGSAELSDAEKASIASWSHMLYRASGQSTPTEAERVQLGNLERALDKIPPEKNRVFRSIIVDKLADVQGVSGGKLKKDELFDADRPLSSSKNEEAATSFSADSATERQTVVVFDIQSKSGADVSNLVAEEYQDQEEVILRAGSRYVIHDVSRPKIGPHGGPLVRVKMVETDYSNKFLRDAYRQKKTLMSAKEQP